jgi:hypothetical protein
MALTIEDLRPKNFTINIQGVELECKPPRLSHTLVLSKIGEIFQNINNADTKSIKSAEVDFDWVVNELMPELKGIELDMKSSLTVIEQIMEQISPEETKELNEKGVSFGTDPKAEKIG